MASNAEIKRQFAEAFRLLGEARTQMHTPVNTYRLLAYALSIISQLVLYYDTLLPEDYEL